MGYLSPLPYLLIYSIILFIISRDSDIYSILWVIIQYYFNLLLKLSQLWTLELFLLDPMLSAMHPAMCFFFFYFLTFWLSPGSSCIFPASVLGSVIFWSPGSFYWRRVLKTKIWVLGMLMATGLLVLLSHLWHQRAEEGNIHVFTKPCINTFLWMWRVHLNPLLTWATQVLSCTQLSGQLRTDAASVSAWGLLAFT